MIHIYTPTPIPFQYLNFVFSTQPCTQVSIIENAQNFLKTLQGFELNSNTLWISNLISKYHHLDLDFILVHCNFPSGLKAKVLANQISNHPLAENFSQEPIHVWQILLKLPINIIENFLLKFSGSKLREIAQLMEEILRTQQELNLVSGESFEIIRAQLLDQRFPITTLQRKKNLDNALTIPKPWVVNILGIQDEQSLELKIKIKDKVELERAKNLFQNEFHKLENLIQELT